MFSITASQSTQSWLPACIQAEDQGDSVTFMFEAANQERISDFELKLMDIDSEQ